MVQELKSCIYVFLIDFIQNVTLLKCTLRQWFPVDVGEQNGWCMSHEISIETNVWHFWTAYITVVLFRWMKFVIILVKMKPSLDRILFIYFFFGTFGIVWWICERNSLKKNSHKYCRARLFELTKEIFITKLSDSIIFFRSFLFVLLSTFSRLSSNWNIKSFIRDDVRRST